jgi:DNA-binding MarR family transcriptional regulator
VVTGAEPAWATWDPASTSGYARPELALVEALDWLGPAFARWVARQAPSGAPTTWQRHRVLRVLTRRGPQRPVEVAAELAMTPATLTGLVDGLAAEGLVTRAPHPTDRRATLLTLTSAGQAAADDTTTATAAAAAFETLSPAEVLGLLAAVKRLATCLREATAPDPSAVTADGGTPPDQPDQQARAALEP